MQQVQVFLVVEIQRLVASHPDSYRNLVSATTKNIGRRLAYCGRPAGRVDNAFQIDVLLELGAEPLEQGAAQAGLLGRHQTQMPLGDP